MTVFRAFIFRICGSQQSLQPNRSPLKSSKPLEMLRRLHGDRVPPDWSSGEPPAATGGRAYRRSNCSQADVISRMQPVHASAICKIRGTVVELGRRLLSASESEADSIKLWSQHLKPTRVFEALPASWRCVVGVAPGLVGGKMDEERWMPCCYS